MVDKVIKFLKKSGVPATDYKTNNVSLYKSYDYEKKKYNFQVHYPGSGVGGPCLPINSYQLLNTAKRTGSNLSIIESGRKINEKIISMKYIYTIFFLQMSLRIKELIG